MSHNEADKIKNRTDNEIISRNFDLIMENFHDVFNKYNFTPKMKATSIISFENDCFEIRFGYERDRYGFVHFGGIGVFVKKAKNSMGYILYTIF